MEIELPPLNGYMGYCLGFMWGMFLIDSYIDWRQYKCICRSVFTDLNDLLRSHFEKDHFEKSQKYAMDKANFSLIQGLYGQIKETAYLLLFAYPFFWSYSRQLANNYGFTGEYWETVCFLVVTTIFETIIGQPWKLYSTFVIEERHGFNKMTLGFYIKDSIKKLAIFTPLNCAIVCGLVWVIKTFGEMFYIYAFIFVSIIVFIMMTVYPEFIAPMFDTYSPLEDGELKEKIEELAGSLDFPLKKLFVVDGSTRSAHSNAYMYGFRKNKRIVLYDTLIKNEKNEKGCDIPEIVSVLAHELGHWKLNHTVMMLIVQEIMVFGVFYTFSLFINNDELFETFGFTGDAEAGIYMKLMVVMQVIMGPVMEVVGIAMVQLVRYNEFGADRFAAELGRADHLESALAKLFKDNSNFPLCDWLYSWRHHSHPHFNERIVELRRQIAINTSKTK